MLSLMRMGSNPPFSDSSRRFFSRTMRRIVSKSGGLDPLADRRAVAFRNFGTSAKAREPTHPPYDPRRCRSGILEELRRAGKSPFETGFAASRLVVGWVGLDPCLARCYALSLVPCLPISYGVQPTVFRFFQTLFFADNAAHRLEKRWVGPPRRPEGRCV